MTPDDVPARLDRPGVSSGFDDELLTELAHLRVAEHLPVDVGRG